ncbi:low affinity immunoglobulin gamma Fc region receptor II-a-like isoform X2 [Anoplopoma fimbria]|uniref:low affinity immunoglobulin gamma Fc region receptor II-a-like isoform X2 n=1 Tax=Anoplopoma fimbria TaxID=229290 RepID=UPI0023EC5BA2|nr:low affinity immunoglobulin gamma Fc region receptor II-a-like isoform X2 [Anoplopoma fimbria]
MKVRALCIRLVMIVLMLLVAHVQQSYPKTPYAAFRIVPTRLQLFEYESVHFTCEGFNVSAGCTVRNIKESIQKCSNDTVTSTVTCTIDYAFVSDTGEYWCEGGGGERSNTVDITVTGGHVILESPVLPVMEGDAVTLSCRYETSSTSLPAVFYKDGLFIGNSSTGNMTIERVSRSDEGLYKCDISGAGESPESRLAVRDGSSTSVSNSDEGLKKSGISGAGESSQIGLAVKVLLEANLNDPKKDLYAVVKKNRKKKKKKKKDAADAEDNLSFGLDSTYCTKPQTEKDNAEPLPQSFRSTFTFDDTSPALQDDEEEETPY